MPLGKPFQPTRKNVHPLNIGSAENGLNQSANF